MASPRRIVVVGGGVAGYSAAAELRARGYDGALGLVDPSGLPYDRPPLSKGYLLGTKDAAGLRLAPEAWYTEHGVELHAARAAALRPAEGAVELDGGRLLAADAVVLATGALPRPLRVPGGDAALTLRTLGDAERLRAALAPGARIAVVGGGLIGAETASGAAVLGAEVTLIEPLDPPLVPAVGEALARRLHAQHAEHGVRVLTAVPERIETGSGGAAHRTYHLTLSDGTAVEADAVVVGIGVVPDTALAAAAGLAVDDGVLVDAAQRTSNPAVFAAGDATRLRRPDGTLARRAEHWEAAVRSGQAAAAGLLGQAPPEFGAPWFWSDRHGVHVESVGSLAGPGEVLVRRTDDGVPTAAFRLAEDGRLLGCAAVDGGLLIKAARRIIDRGTVVDPETLADPGDDLRRRAR
ncbi:NAD(P)/FAD-dependent oxidoreductase [Sinomonas mesophila]|uniref:NAD(P)/FAD-dependent oxidoreductase n=1 Tax=Sinomonas mesophila TaxID=1531955 RepID=UPI000986E5BF|nr:FAD-dependent oxidoreductase [Sinomonas mesophila]